MLKRLGFRTGADVDVACDGVEAVEMASRRPYGLVFMDVQMPRMDGLAATRHILAAARANSSAAPSPPTASASAIPAPAPTPIPFAVPASTPAAVEVATPQAAEQSAPTPPPPIPPPPPPPPPPFICALSAGVLESERACCFDAGMAAFVPKPFQLADIRAV